MPKWIARFLSLANEVATWSKDPDCKVGVVIVSPDKRLMTTGYNGFPAGVRDKKNRLSTKTVKNYFMVHAEVNAIVNARRDLTGWTLYSTKPPCLNCAKVIIQAGITAVYCPAIDENSSWKQENTMALDLLKEAQIQAFLVRDGVLNQA